MDIAVPLLHRHQQKLIHLKLFLAMKVNNQYMVTQAKAPQIKTRVVAQRLTQMTQITK